MLRWCVTHKNHVRPPEVKVTVQGQTSNICSYAGRCLSGAHLCCLLAEAFNKMRKSVMHNNQFCTSKIKAIIQGQRFNISSLFTGACPEHNFFDMNGFSNHLAEIFSIFRQYVTHKNQVCLPKVKVIFQGQTFNIASMQMMLVRIHNFVNYQRIFK
jgi:hypothetical protein